MKPKTMFYCTECGNETPKWAGKCPACGAWNTIVEEPAAPKAAGRGASRPAGAAVRRARPVTELEADGEIRFSTGMGELDRVLGGGAVKGSLVLVGGAPGIGKSTLMLQICESLCRENKVLYVSGEESEHQLKLGPNGWTSRVSGCLSSRRSVCPTCWRPWRQRRRTC